MIFSLLRNVTRILYATPKREKKDIPEVNVNGPKKSSGKGVFAGIVSVKSPVCHIMFSNDHVLAAV